MADVKRVMDDYIATLTEAERGQLPPICNRALATDDVAGSALILIREEINYAGDPQVSALLHEVAHTFVAASNRIVSIQSRGQPVVGTPLP